MRLIDADAFLKELKKYLIGIHQTYLAEAVLRIVKQVISKQPTIEAKPVVHAHWENKIIGFFSCSHCDNSTRNNMSDHKEQTALFNDKFGMTAFAYCPHCGAQMDEERSENF